MEGASLNELNAAFETVIDKRNDPPYGWIISFCLINQVELIPQSNQLIFVGRRYILIDGSMIDLSITGGR